MGQQQLLLLVLGIVIVGIAIIVGINAYSENNTRANWDALLQDGLRMASDAQSWKGKPELFGGSPDATKTDTLDFSLADFHQMSYAGVRITNAGLCYSNLNGVFGLEPTLAAGLTIDAANQANGNALSLVITGTNEAQIDLIDANSVKGFANVSTGVAVSSIPDPTGC